ncbi:MAG: murein transglycosylase A [Acidobacteriota bacterium]
MMRNAPLFQILGGRWARGSALCAMALAVLAGCAHRGQTDTEQAGEAVDTSGLHAGGQAGSGRAGTRPDAALTAAKPFVTRYATFQPVAFDSLPGWQQDNLAEAWSAFKESCKALERKPHWTALCAQVKTIHDPLQGRQWLEREFTVLRVQNTDRTLDGDITGYYEPLLQGQASRGGAFVVPVYGVPRDLYAFDWKQLPPSQRKGGAWVKPSGPGSRTLVPASAGEPGAVSLDLRRFTLDTLDRRLRIRLQGGEALPYYARSDIDQQGGLNAPVLAWVDDPVALYAMQIQGAGRIRMADGSTLRLQYADQNGHPFKPMQLATSGNERVLTRGRSVEGDDEVVEHFELADAAPDADASPQPTDEPLTRGRRKAAPAGGGDDASQAIVQDLLSQGRREAGASRPATAAKAAPRVTSSGISASLLAQRAQALAVDPSYVFFRVAPDQSPKTGPVGALGVPLSAGRSLAVDPRVMPLGYPVFLSAAGDVPRQGRMQRLMFAQDTGGAIRGAVRADYFWGYGADAGRQARQTRHRGRMWLMVPHSDVADLQAARPLTRGANVPTMAPVCLLEDPAYCEED